MVQLVECFSSMHEVLCSAPSTINDLWWHMAINAAVGDGSRGIRSSSGPPLHSKSDVSLGIWAGTSGQSPRGRKDSYGLENTG